MFWLIPAMRMQAGGEEGERNGEEPGERDEVEMGKQGLRRVEAEI